KKKIYAALRRESENYTFSIFFIDMMKATSYLKSQNNIEGNILKDNKLIHAEVLTKAEETKNSDGFVCSMLCHSGSKKILKKVKA
ncbi:MAG TPA: hypothetical protein PLD62_07645, partial [Candidatus Cloacimonadota bacterium]|nr:hypothetical protein [Candidatus Cloacimonadota bacterium]